MAYQTFTIVLHLYMHTHNFRLIRLNYSDHRTIKSGAQRSACIYNQPQNRNNISTYPTSHFTCSGRHVVTDMTCSGRHAGERGKREERRGEWNREGEREGGREKQRKKEDRINNYSPICKKEIIKVQNGCSSQLFEVLLAGRDVRRQVLASQTLNY